jgi:tetratricopeptide (TPR) repeat protein
LGGFPVSIGRFLAEGTLESMSTEKRRPGPSAPKRPSHTDLPRELVDELRQVVRGPRADRAIADLERAVTLLARGDHKAAVKEATKAKEIAQRSAAVREVLGLALYQGERFREAMAELKAYRRISGRADQNHLIADCYRALGSPEKAVPLVEEEMRARVPEEARAEAAVVGASALADMQRYPEALALLRRFSRRSDVGRDWDLRVWYVTGDILERAGRPEEAAREFKKVVRHDSAAFDAAERLAQLS